MAESWPVILSPTRASPHHRIPAFTTEAHPESLLSAATLETLPREILRQIATHLDTVSSVAFGLSSPSIYGAHFSVHGAVTNLYTQTMEYAHRDVWNLYQVIHAWCGLREFLMVRRWEGVDLCWGLSGYVTNFVPMAKVRQVSCYGHDDDDDDDEKIEG